MDAFSATGTYGQYIFVDRPSRTVVVMMSYGLAAGGRDRAGRMFRAIVEELSTPKRAIVSPPFGGPSE